MKWNKEFWKNKFSKVTNRFDKFQNRSLYFIFFILVGAVGAVKYYNFTNNYQHEEFSTFSLWQTAQTEVTNRAPASANLNQGPSCSYNFVSLDQLKAETKKLETKYQTGSIIEGKFHGLDLIALPSIGAQLLADHKSLIGNKNTDMDFSKCVSVPCVFNKIYNDSTKLSGYFVYYWYLKTGSMISLTNFIPEQKSVEAGKYHNQHFSFQDYLFNQNELRNFYFLAKSLPEKLTFIPLMKSIHKVPGQGKIEKQRNEICSVSLPNGQILLGKDCISTNPRDFFLKVTKQIAVYVDRHEGLKKNISSLSQSKEWKFLSDWFKESYFNTLTHDFAYKWKSNLPNNQFISNDARRSPSEQLASLIAHYRFNPEEFKAKTPQDIRHWVKKSIYAEKTYDSQGLYNQYIHQSLNTWARQEVGLWKSCLDEHVTDEKTIEELRKDIAKSLDHPLYSCVEGKIPAFVEFVKQKIQKENFEGCEFFNTPIKYGHMSRRFDTNVKKYLLEKILQRKIEIQKHGPEVLTAQSVKNEFINFVDPKNIYISCFDKTDSKFCYEMTMKSKLQDIMKEFPRFSNYYKKIVQEDILALYPFEHVKSKSNEAAKLFLAPYAARLHQAANKMWNSCKDLGMDQSEPLKLPMKFSGGKNFVNPKLINCVNDKVEKELISLAGMKAFHVVSGERQAFELNKQEQKFALSFLEGKLLQTLNNLLDDEYVSEKARFKQHFSKVRIAAITEFSDDSSMLDNIFSLSQVKHLCMNKVGSFYPENYFYHSKHQMDKKFGDKICTQFVSLPNIKKKLNEQVAQQWQLNKDLAVNYLAENYQDLVDSCYSDYPKDKRGRNQRYRNICIQQAFEEATFQAIKEWRGHKHYKYFGDRENEVVGFFNSRLRSDFISKANQRQPLLRQPSSVEENQKQ